MGLCDEWIEPWLGKRAIRLKYATNAAPGEIRISDVDFPSLSNDE